MLSLNGLILHQDKHKLHVWDSLNLLYWDSCPPPPKSVRTDGVRWPHNQFFIHRLFSNFYSNEASAAADAALIYFHETITSIQAYTDQFRWLLLIGKRLSITTVDHHYQNLWQRLYVTECVNFKHNSKPWTIARCSLYETCWPPVVHRTKLSVDTLVWAKRES